MTHIPLPKLLTALALFLIGTMFLWQFLQGMERSSDTHVHDGGMRDDAAMIYDGVYEIEGEQIALRHGVSTSTMRDSSALLTTTYFGNAVEYDANADATPEAVFLVSQERGGSGVFYYAIVAKRTETGWQGTDALFLGDRISPQSTHVSEDGTISINFAERALGAPYTDAPSVGNTVRVRVDPATLRFGIIAGDMEGEADPSRMTLGMKEWVWVRTQSPDGSIVTPRTPDSFRLSFPSDTRFTGTTDCNSIFGDMTVRQRTIHIEAIGATKMYCDGAQEPVYLELLGAVVSFVFTSRGELILTTGTGSRLIYR
jgi:heat shock protein HslJ